MEKLLITLTHSDNYTYSSEQTLPVLFNSKEEFIITLEDIVNKYIKDIEFFEERSQKYQKKYNTESQSYSHLIDKYSRSKDTNHSQIEKAVNKFKQATDEFNEFFTKNKPKDEFYLGGQTFNFENFTYIDENSKKIHINIPQIYTINEFFSPLDINLSNKIKP